MAQRVIVVTGAGGLGLAIARRLGSGRRLFMAEFSDQALDNARTSLRDSGYDVECHLVDVSNYQAVEDFARLAAAAGPLESIVHTAGVARSAMGPRKTYEINLLGTANVVDAFLPFATRGTSLVCIASLAGHSTSLSQELERHLATAPRDQLLFHKELDVDAASPMQSYGIAKRGNQLRVAAAASSWGAKGARINSVSPGLIYTPMGQRELEGSSAAQIHATISTSPMQRIGTPDDVGSAVAFLCGPESSYITGTDLLIDGGVLSAQFWPHSNFGTVE
ncbi:hypothetical protein ACHAPM_011750 [Fusarium culmorum]